MRIAIIEDEELHKELLEEYLRQWSAEKEAAIEIQAFPSAESFLFVWEDANDFDILFVDIQMREMNGMEMARKIRERDEDIAIVFTTGISDYIEDGYEVEALHYLIKPISREKVGQCMDKALHRSSSERYILVHGRDEVLKLPVRRITYIEAQGHGCVAETCSKEGETVRTELAESISEMEALLSADGFMKCHRSYLCRIGSIRQIGKAELTFDNGSRVPVSRRMYAKINQAFIRKFRHAEDIYRQEWR
ncbi:MAG: LytTR family DNA-binding domain-containing protein [Roseburia sp.]|nr:LytTR family DNA-binding domain-containing protein [Roseburia sp.]